MRGVGEAVLDFASRGGLDTADDPWPIVEPAERYARRYDGLLPICSSCGHKPHGICEGGPEAIPGMSRAQLARIVTRALASEA